MCRTHSLLGLLCPDSMVTNCMSHYFISKLPQSPFFHVTAAGLTPLLTIRVYRCLIERHQGSLKTFGRVLKTLWMLLITLQEKEWRTFSSFIFSFSVRLKQDTLEFKSLKTSIYPNIKLETKANCMSEHQALQLLSLAVWQFPHLFIGGLPG